MISITELRGSGAWRYLMESVTDGQGDLRSADAITRYYTEAGTPPGRWMGTGLGGLGHGEGLAAGSTVTGEQLDLLLGQGRDPISGDPLGQGFRQPPSFSQRVATRVRFLPDDLTGSERDAAIEKIRDEERRRTPRRAVAGFDYTFSPPKSVSTLWAIADHGTREQITAAHHDAIGDVLALIERNVARTRVGTNGVAQVRVTGVVAAAFDHYDSRDHDPQLHTHLVVANRVQADDGKWRTLDSRGGIFPSLVALSETYDDLLADHLTRRLGVGWEVRDPGRKLKNAKWEISGIPAQLIEHFSLRSTAIRTRADELIGEYRDHTGREPDDASKLKLRRRATLETRVEKTLYPLATLAGWWRRRATEILGGDPGVLVEQVIYPARWEQVLRADDLTGPRAEELVDEILARLHESRATWTRWNILAETARATMKYRMATTADRDRLHERLVTAVQDRSVLLSSPPLASTPAVFRRGDGTSMFTPEHGHVFTSAAILDAEARLLEVGRARTGPIVDGDLIEDTAADDAQRRLSDDQAAAIYAVATSGRPLDVLVGAAGSGKTTALAALRHAWQAKHGAGSVVGLAPTAKAAEVLAGSLGITTENTAKWLTEHARNPTRREHLRTLHDQTPSARETGDDRAAARLAAEATALSELIDRWEFGPGQLVIVDEASMCGTLALDTLTSHARQAGAKVLLVGDWAQLSAVESGGAFRMLAGDRADPPELSTVRRFHQPWERAASVRLRIGDDSAIDTYLDHDRIRAGATVDMTDAAYAAWAADEQAGRSSLLIAATNTTVAELNTRARADRIAWGQVETDGIALHDDTTAGVGDRIVTRQIDRTLTTGPHSWVKNGDHWTVVQRFNDGSVAVWRATDPGGSRVLTLPAAYVATHVELGYATTAHRAQGDTVDTTHALITPTSSREILYVAMTRGRASNTAYVCTDTRTDDEHAPADDDPTVRDILEEVFARTSADHAAHDVLRAEQERVGSIAQLAAEYDTLAREARTDYWATLATTALPHMPAEDVAASPAWPGLVDTLRRAEAASLDLYAALPRLAPPPGDDDTDPVTVLRDRVEHWYDTASSGLHTPPTLIAGLIPAARHIPDPEMRQALAERAALIEQRADALAARALADGEPWITTLGAPPHDPAQRMQWEHAAATVAAYRDRYGVTDTKRPLGEPRGGGQWTRHADRRRAQTAVGEARQLAEHTRAKWTKAATGHGVDPRPSREL